MRTGLESIRAGVGRTLFVWFLIVSLIPLSLAALMTHQQATSALRLQAERTLSFTLNDQARRIEQFFADRTRVMEVLAQSNVIGYALERLQHSWKKSGHSLEEFVMTPEWLMIAELIGMELSRLSQGVEFDEVLLVDEQGHVLFSSNRSAWLGGSLFSDAMTGPGVAQTARQALLTDTPCFVDMEWPVDGSMTQVGFLVHSLHTPYIHSLGLLVMRFSFQPLKKLLRDHSWLSQSGKSLIIGQDLRTRLVVSQDDSAQEIQRVETRLSHEWQKMEEVRHATSGQAGNGSEANQVLHYLDHRGVDVLGQFRDVSALEKLQTHWALLAEVDVDEALANQNMGIKVGLTLVALTVVILLLSAFVVGRLVAPLQQLTQWVTRRAEGEVRPLSIPMPDHELGVLAQSFQKLLDVIGHSTQELQAQQQELTTAYASLRDKANRLEESKARLETVSQYKAQFLARMSHELRTPLHSILILASLLTKNESRNLTTDQVESAGIIHSSGADLLKIIDDILNLAKMESGTVPLQWDEIPVELFVQALQYRFLPMAKDKGLTCQLEMASDTPERLVTDRGKVMQILTNLMANAIKFTSIGGVIVRFAPAEMDDQVAALAVTVMDTGIGIPLDKQQLIFDSFQQVDGSISRQYGGTGLGLAISRELATLLGGEIGLRSEEGQGSAFTLTLPLAPSRGVSAPILESVTEEIGDEGLPSREPSPLLLISDDSKAIHQIMAQAEQRGIPCLLARDGHRALGLIRSRQPAGIILDLILPDMDGWELLEHLKRQASTRLIPVFLISVQSSAPVWKSKGAMGYLPKPFLGTPMDHVLQRLLRFSTSQARTVLIVEPDPMTRQFMASLFAPYPIRITMAGSVDEVLPLLAAQRFDCMILELNLPGRSGDELLQLLEENHQASEMPVIVYSARDWTQEDYLSLRRHTETIIRKGGDAENQLVEQVMVLLHLQARSAESPAVHVVKMDSLLVDKTVLIVNPDMRTSYHLIKLLKQQGIYPHAVANVSKALTVLHSQKGVDVIVLSATGSDQEGCAAIDLIRNQPLCANIPMIVLADNGLDCGLESDLNPGVEIVASRPLDPEALLNGLNRVFEHPVDDPGDE